MAGNFILPWCPLAFGKRSSVKVKRCTNFMRLVRMPYNLKLNAKMSTIVTDDRLRKVFRPVTLFRVTTLGKSKANLVSSWCSLLVSSEKKIGVH